MGHKYRCLLIIACRLQSKFIVCLMLLLNFSISMIVYQKSQLFVLNIIPWFFRIKHIDFFRNSPSILGKILLLIFLPMEDES